MANGLTPFDDEFENLTGNRPLAWQRRLYADWFEKGSIPPVIDLPTGLAW